MYNSHYSFFTFLGTARARDSVSSRSQCIISPATAVIEIEQIPTLEAHSTDAIRPLKYTAAVGPPKKVRLGFMESPISYSGQNSEIKIKFNNINS